MLNDNNACKKPNLPGRLLVHGDYGSGKRLVALPAIDNAKDDQKLIAALLRKDCLTARQVSKIWQTDPDIKQINNFCQEVALGNLPVLIYERLLEMGLAAHFGEITLEDGSSLFDFLRKRAACGIIEGQEYSQRFLQLLSLLKDISPPVIWLKGSSLSRLIYEHQEQRLSFDFDLLVAKEAAQAVFAKLIGFGFSPIWNQPGFCHQIFVGPVGTLADLFLAPSKQCEGCHNLTLVKPDWPYIELKFNALDNGLKMQEESRLFAQSLKCQFLAETFYAPNSIDHLLLELTHLHKHGFQGWAWLYDIHLLATSLDDQSWQEFVRRARLEGIEMSAWLGLACVCDRLNTEIPQFVFAQLKPKQIDSLFAPFLPAISMEFIWNCNSLPMLLLNAAFVGDSKRKYQALQEMFFPGKKFLVDYYNQARPITWWNYWYYLLIHWLIIICPAGLIRHTIGPIIWHSADTVSEMKSATATDNRSGTM